MNGGYIIDRCYAFLVSSDSIEHCFRDFLKYITSQGYTVRLCNRLAHRHSKDGGWQEEYHVFGGGGAFVTLVYKLAHGEQSAIVEKPAIQYNDSLTDEILDQWSKPYLGNDGDDYERWVWAEKDDDTFLFVLSTVYPRCAELLTVSESIKWEKNLDSSFVWVQRMPFHD